MIDLPQSTWHIKYDENISEIVESVIDVGWLRLRLRLRLRLQLWRGAVVRLWSANMKNGNSKGSQHLPIVSYMLVVPSP